MKKIMNLESKLLATVAKCFPALRHDERLGVDAWAKELHGVVSKYGDLIAFAPGYFVPHGEIEVDIEPRLFLVKTVTTTGDHLTVVMMDADGSLVCTNLYAFDPVGWVRRFGDEILELLMEIKSGAARQWQI